MLKTIIEKFDIWKFNAKTKLEDLVNKEYENILDVIQFIVFLIYVYNLRFFDFITRKNKITQRY